MMFPARQAESPAACQAAPDAALARALMLSNELLAAADQGDMTALAELDAQRLQLLESFKADARQIAAADRSALREISLLNERAIGLVEHHRRIKERALDLAAVGRRAVAAYANHRSPRPDQL